jgi:VanZ family protein
MLRWCAVILWAAVIFTLSSIPSLELSFMLRKFAHMGVYAVLTVLLFLALHTHTKRKQTALVLAALLAGCYGLSDEWHQTFVAGRHGAFRDVGIDVMGIAGSYALVQYLPFRAARIFEGMTSMAQCPTCQGTWVYRSRRRGVLEWHSRLIRLAPFRCDTCLHRFWRFTLQGR